MWIYVKMRYFARLGTVFDDREKGSLMLCCCLFVTERHNHWQRKRSNISLNTWFYIFNFLNKYVDRNDLFLFTLVCELDFDR